MHTTIQELQQSLLHCDASIVYLPMRGEVDYRDPSFPLTMLRESLILPSDKRADPFTWAEKCKTQFAERRPYLLIPGRQFDVHGTRHGTGGGWYDRFLSRVPREWLRIGIAYTKQVSFSRLTHASWDETVDWILACDGSAWNAYRV